MSLQIVPVDTTPRQNFDITLSVDGQNLTLNLTVRFNEVSGYWLLDISDKQKVGILQGIPLVPGISPADNLLNQYTYLQIGSLYVLKTDNINAEYPGVTDLGSFFMLVWGDTV